MLRNLSFWFVLLVAFKGALAQDQQADEAAIRATVEAYVAAFNSGDAKALANHWSPDAVYRNRSTGEQAVGRADIEKQFAAAFVQSKGMKLDVTVESIQFLSPNVAVEYGQARLTDSGETPEETSYSAVYVKRDGQWLLDRVTDEELPVVRSHYDQLKSLEWLIGGWVDEDENARIVTRCTWTKNRNFILRYFSVAIDDAIDLSGIQIIGWDPAAKRIRSWVFDSDGGFGQGEWSQDGNRWDIKKTGVLPDGRQTSSVNIIKKLDDNTHTVQSVSRTVDGELLPNIDEVKVVRQTEE